MRISCMEKKFEKHILVFGMRVNRHSLWDEGYDIRTLTRAEKDPDNSKKLGFTSVQLAEPLRLSTEDIDNLIDKFQMT